MSDAYPWIYVDLTNNLWKFLLSNNNELSYNIMYGEGKWTKESLIDTEVLGFTIYIEENEIIHIVYSNSKGELKYCTMRNKQWVGKTLYQLQSDEFDIQDLKVEIIGEDMHIFFMLIANDDSEHGVLSHCKWNGNEAVVNKLQDIILIPNLQEHYFLQVGDRNNLNLFFITDNGDEASMHICSFRKNKWKAARRLYGIQGDSISFDVLSRGEEVHILNKYREDGAYLLDHVGIDMSDDIKESRVYESSMEPVEPLLFIENGSLFCCFLEGSNVFYSAFDGVKWGEVVLVQNINESELQRYNSFIYNDDENIIMAIGIYGTKPPDLHLYIPNQFLENVTGSIEYRTNQAEVPHKEKDELLNLKTELRQVKAEKKSLEKKIASFNMQLQKKQKFIEDYEENISKISEQKRKIEENCNVFLEVQQDIQKELERTKQQLSEDITRIELLQNSQKESKLENELLRMEVEKVSGENRKLLDELQLERSQTIMDRLLRRRPGY